MKTYKKIWLTTAITAMLMGSSLLPVQAAEPAYYDLRLAVPTEQGSGSDSSRLRINPIRNQGMFRTCWAFGIVAAAESNIYTKLQQNGITYDTARNSVDFSEWYLAWVSYATPVGVENDTIKHAYEVSENFYQPFASKIYNIGGISKYNIETMMANGTALQYDDGNGIIAPAQYSPSVAKLCNIFWLTEPANSEKGIQQLKQLVRENGAVAVAINSGVMAIDSFESAFYNARKLTTAHAVNIIGWDDNFDFSGIDLAEKPVHKGAWIIRNSWGTEFGDKGYCYLSYEDKTLSDVIALDMSMDSGFYSHINRHEANAVSSHEKDKDRLYLPAEVAKGSAFAAGYTSRRSAFLRQVGFYAMNTGMEYTIEIRKGTRSEPEGGTLVYTQRGRFGDDGSPAWTGYRTVELAKAVFLPEGTDYLVSVALNNPQGKAVYMLAPSVAERPELVTSYIRLGETGKWQQVLQRDAAKLPDVFSRGSVIERCYLKDSTEPVGSSFTVTSFDDTTAADKAAAVIDLGRNGELYGKDMLNTQRETLTDMTVSVADKDEFSGTIKGEGRLIKTGHGQLMLRGSQKYTGDTEVHDGTLLLAARSDGTAAALNGSVVLAGGQLGGAGSVKGNISGQGTLVLNPAGALQVNGAVDLTSIKLETNGAIHSGVVLLRADKGINGINGIPDNCLVMLNADRTAIVVK